MKLLNDAREPSGLLLSGVAASAGLVLGLPLPAAILVGISVLAVKVTAGGTWHIAAAGLGASALAVWLAPSSADATGEPPAPGRSASAAAGHAADSRGTAAPSGGRA